MHAASVAAELGIERILCPRAGGVLSALGLCASDRRRDTTRTVMLAGSDLSAARIAEEVEELAAMLAGDLPGAQPEAVYEMRYSGQSFELPVPGSIRPDPAELRERFEAAHERRYGHRDPDGEVVLVHIRLAMVLPGPQLPLGAAAAGAAAESERSVRFDGAWVETPVLRGEPAAGTRAEGPIVFELPEATFVLPPGWRAEVDDAGTIGAYRS
jgi:N-methylhydantoinase A